MNSDKATPFRIQDATEAEIPAILDLIRGLAEYEKLSHEVLATEERLRASLFGQERAAEVLIGFVGPEPVGFAVFFRNFSTFLGKSGLYLEDLFVLPTWRRRGFGQQLMRRVAAIAVERGYGRMEWTVVNWNEPAIGFYKALGAQPMNDWTIHRLTDDSLLRFASEEQ